jgi:hypothetical protein
MTQGRSMSQNASTDEKDRQSIVSGVLRALIVFDTVALLFAGIVHLVGARIPLGFAVFTEPPLIPAGIVESMAGLVFLVAGYAVFAGKASAWGWTLGAHLFAIAGFVLGIVATRNGTTPFNHDYHIAVLAVFLCGLLLLMLPGVRGRLTRSARAAR